MPRTAAFGPALGFLAQRGFGLIHPQIRQPIGFLVLFPPHMLERHVVQLADQEAGPGGQRLQAWMLHPVFPAHLLHEQLGVRAHLNLLMAVIDRPLQGAPEGRCIRQRC